MFSKFFRYFKQIHDQWLALVYQIYPRKFPMVLVSGYLITGAALTVTGFLVFSKLASELLENELLHLDISVTQWLVSFRTGWLTKLMQDITNLGSTGWLIGLVLVVSILGLWFQKYVKVLSLAVVVGGALLLTELLKATFQRVRPDLPWLTIASGYSFPSGHTLNSMALYGFLSYLVFRNCNNKINRYVWSTGLFILALLIGISRVYLGVHYPSDVLAGWAVAGGWLGTCITGIELLKKHNHLI